MHIRKMTAHDINDVSALVSSLSHLYLINEQRLLPEWFTSTLSDLQFSKRIENEKFTNFVCEINSSIVGYLSMKECHHLYHLFVTEKQQGKGIATILWHHAMSNCHSDFYTLRSSLFAIPFYKQIGFIESGPLLEKDGIGFQPMELNL